MRLTRSSVFLHEVTSEGLHDRKDILGPLVGSDGRVDPREVSLPNALADGPDSC